MRSGHKRELDIRLGKVETVTERTQGCLCERVRIKRDTQTCMDKFREQEGSHDFPLGPTLSSIPRPFCEATPSKDLNTAMGYGGGVGAVDLCFGSGAAHIY